MPTLKLGKLEEVNPRDIWSYDFTSWLAANLDLLGDALGLNLTLTARGVSGVVCYWRQRQQGV